MTSTPQKPEMPDIAANQSAPFSDTLNWVGMSQVALPVTISDHRRGRYQAQAKVQTYVDIARADVKGIHMSRLYLLLTEFSRSQVLNVTSLKQFLQEKLLSHQDISRDACLEIRFDYLLEQPALKSEYSGWKAYPVVIKAQSQQGSVRVELGVSVPYSSTCPCSAALSRQLLQQAFINDFANQEHVDKTTIEQWLRSERGSVATPHSQRSYANVWVVLEETHQDLPISSLIQQIETALKTAVQTAVKREDEQEFARLNGANQMFCEDAARRLKHALNQESLYHDFWLRIEHIESLHAHDAVAIATKGINHGYQPLLHR